MKKLFFLLIILTFIYFSLSMIVHHFGPGYAISYRVNDFKVEEIYTNNQKGEMQNYYFKLSQENILIGLQIHDNFGYSQKVIKEIKSYQDETVFCVLPIFNKNEILTDLICLKGNIIYNYNDLKGTNNNLDHFYTSIGLSSHESPDEIETIENIKIYKKNLLNDYYVSFNSYKGFVTVKSSKQLLEHTDIFKNDVYDHYLSTYLNNNYVTVDYDEKYGYSKIYIYDIADGQSDHIILPVTLERNSYIQGTYLNSLYVFDRFNEKQYEINIKAKTVKEVGNKTKGIKIYRNNQWENISIFECLNNDILFEKSGDAINDYIFLTSSDGDDSGYSYYYKKTNDSYEIYRINKQNPYQISYILTTKHLDKIKAINEYLFFIQDNYIKYYSDKTGIRVLLSNNEIYFNQNIKYNVIYKK